MAFTVQLDAFHGPLDLLLYLVRKQELEIVELSLARVTEQFLEYIALLEALDVDAVGDFLDVASSLLEIKSRRVLPLEQEEPEPEEEPREDLVQRLLEFKQFRDEAERLQEMRQAWSQRRPRIAKPIEPHTLDPSDQQLAGVELWDLVSAFARVMRQRQADDEPETILYDETPVHVHMRRVYDRLTEAKDPLPMAELFPVERVHKSTLVGVFLAILELVRHRHALAEQPERFGEITLQVGPVELPSHIGAETQQDAA